MRAFLEFLITQTVGDQRDDKTNQRLAEHGVPASRGSLRQRPVAHWLEPAAYNGLVAGSSTAGPTRKLGYLSSPFKSESIPMNRESISKEMRVDFRGFPMNRESI